MTIAPPDHEFYDLNRGVQGLLALLMAALLLAIVLLWMRCLTTLWVLPTLLLWMGSHVFLLTPTYTLIGYFRYLSPLLLYTREGTTVHLHHGTAFDYVFAMPGVRPGFSWRRRVLAYHVAGLLELIRRLEAGELTGVECVDATTYFLDNAIVQRLGFVEAPASEVDRFNVYGNALDLFWMYALARGRLCFPPLGRVKKFRISTADLLRAKPILRTYEGRLSL